MPNQTTSNLSNSLAARYKEKYFDAAEMERLYDQIAAPFGEDMATMQKSSAVYEPFLSDMTPGVTAISETTDVTPQTIRDALASITPTSRGEAIQCSEKLLIQTYTDYAAKRFEVIGKNMMESVDLLAQAAALKGALVNRYTTRASTDAGTATHRLTDSVFSEVQTEILTLKVPGFKFEGGQVWTAIMHPATFHDLREGGNVDSIGLYQNMGIHLNYELGKIGNFRIVVSPWAKVFGGAGADNGTNAATTLAEAATALGTTITVTSATSLEYGKWLTIGTEETANTHYPTNERVKYVSASGTIITIVGEGPNGGLRFDHDAGAAVRNADSVYTVVFGGPASLAKLYATEVGEFGSVVGPTKNGLLEQFVSLGWKWYGGYALMSESHLVRGEYSSSQDA
jgi:N4-gp56 family major capsid protein